MANFDLPLEDLQAYQPERSEAADFDAFWADTLAASRAKATAPDLTPYTPPLKTVDVFDVSFSGFDGQRVKAWLVQPAGTTGPLPCVVEYIGYGGGRGFPSQRLLWSAAGLRPFRRRQSRSVGGRHAGYRYLRGRAPRSGLPDPRDRVAGDALLSPAHD